MSVEYVITPENLTLISLMPHSVRLLCTTGGIIELPPSGYTLTAMIDEIVTHTGPAYYHMAINAPSKDGARILEIIQKEAPGAVLIAAHPVARAYGGQVVALRIVAGYEGVQRDKRIYYSSRFLSFPPPSDSPVLVADALPPLLQNLADSLAAASSVVRHALALVADGEE